MQKAHIEILRKNFKVIRQTLGETQAEFGKHVGMSVMLLRGIETGSKTIPRSMAISTMSYLIYQSNKESYVYMMIADLKLPLDIIELFE